MNLYKYNKSINVKYVFQLIMKIRYMNGFLYYNNLKLFIFRKAKIYICKHVLHECFYIIM